MSCNGCNGSGGCGWDCGGSGSGCSGGCTDTIPGRYTQQERKRSAEVLDTTIRWRFPDGDTVLSAVWSVIGGDGALTIASDIGHLPSVSLAVDQCGRTVSDATAWIQGGSVGSIYVVQCLATTAAGRKPARQLTVEIIP